MKRIKNYVKEIVDTLNKPVVALLPGHLSFSIVLSFIPMLSLIGLIAFKLSISITTLKEFLTDFFPGETGEILTNYLNRDSIYFDGVLFAFLAILISSNGMYSLIRISNLLYGLVEEKFFYVVKNRIKSLLMAFLMISLIIFMFIVLGWGNSIIILFSKIGTFEHFNESLDYFYKIIKYPLSFIIIYFIIKIIYTLAPNEKIKSKSVNWGSIFTTISLIIVTVIYSLYITLTRRYNILYGGLSNIFILFVWLYIVSFVFIIGFIINVNNSKKLKENKRGKDETKENI